LFSGGFTEIGFILFIAFLIFGPKKLPEIARILGKGMGELRRASNDLKFSLEEEIRNLDRKDEDVSYPAEDTYPYLESKVESSEPSEEDAHHYLEGNVEGGEHPGEEAHHYMEGELESSGYPEEETHEIEPQAEGNLEPAPKYGYNHSESPLEEPEPRS
jgi:TatA/E family protein of Tat protein translocase